MEAVVIVPMLPGRACSPNGGHHWQARMRDRRELRECARLSAILFLDPKLSPLRDFLGYEGIVTLDAEIGWCCGRKRMDDDNAVAALKSARDGIADVLWAGEDKHVRTGEIWQVRGGGTVRIWLRALEGS